MHSQKAFWAVLMASALGFGSMTAQAALPSTFDLTDQWSVAPASMDGQKDGNGVTPCILANQYDNGFKIRFTGGQGQVFMMAIDFRQNIFAQGQAYPTKISVNGAQVAQKQGRAFNASTLLFDVRDINGFGDALKSGQSLNLDVQGNVMNFSLSQIEPAMARMEACGMAPDAPKPSGEQQEAKAMPQTVVPASVKKPEATAKAEPVASKPEAKVKEPVVAEAKTDKTKAREVYVRRRVKPVEADMEMAAQARELASLETAAGGDEAAEAPTTKAVKYPEPIDLLRDKDVQAPSKGVSIVSKRPEMESPASKINADAPVLVSRRDQSLRMENTMDSRPQEMALFDGKADKPVSGPVSAQESVVATPAQKPKVPIVEMPKMAMKAIVQKLSPKDKEDAPQASEKPMPIVAQKPKETGEEFLQQSSQQAEEEMQKTAMAEPEPTPVPRAPEPAQKTAQKTPMPYPAIKRQTPYEPIKVEPVTKGADADKIQISKAQQNDVEKEALSPGVKVVDETPDIFVADSKAAPAWMPPKDIKASSKKPVVPDTKDVLDAQDEAIIPISTVRSKEIFVSRAEEQAKEQDIEKLAQALAMEIIKAKEAEEAAQETPAKVSKNVDMASANPQSLEPLQPIISNAKPAGQPMGMPKTAARQNWTAKAGEDIKIVLARWAERAGTDLVWEADRGGQLSQDINTQGSFEQAVQTLMSQNGEALGIDGAFEGQQQAPLQVARTSKQTEQTPISLINSAPQDIEPAAGVEVMSQTNDLRPFLERISGQQGVKVMWNAQRDFTMKQPVNMNGPFEETLRAALEQFDNDPVRPVGQLNINPETGEKILVIESERSL